MKISIAADDKVGEAIDNFTDGVVKMPWGPYAETLPAPTEEDPDATIPNPESRDAFRQRFFVEFCNYLAGWKVDRENDLVLIVEKKKSEDALVALSEKTKADSMAVITKPVVEIKV